jgi:serine/threonine-protein kinase HipA
MDNTGVWTLAPAYDLTFSSGPRGEQSTMVMGMGKNPDFTHLQQLGKQAGLTQKRIQEIFAQTSAALSGWPQLARQHGVHIDTIQFIQKRLMLRS